MLQVQDKEGEVCFMYMSLMPAFEKVCEVFEIEPGWENLRWFKQLMKDRHLWGPSNKFNNHQGERTA